MLKTRTVRLRSLLILLTALGLLPIALLGAWSINSAINQQFKEFERSMLGLSRALASAVDAELDATISSLRGMSHSPALIKGDIETFYSSAVDTVRTRPEWAGIVLTDGKGKVLFRTDLPFDSPDMRITDPDSLAKVIATKDRVIGRIAKNQTGAPEIPVRVPVIINGDLAYVLTAAITPRRILEIVQRQQVTDTWVISVHDASTMRVARSKDHDKTVVTGISPTLAELMRGAKREGTGISRTLEGVEAITAFTRNSPHGWAVVIGAPTVSIQQTLIKSVAAYIAGIVVSLGICIVLAFSISRRIVDAISKLQQQAARLGQGQAVHIEPNPIDEVNQMGLALQAASEKRASIEQERKALMASLNDALASLQEALTRAEEAGKAKDNFLAVLGHELRNPLAPILTALDLMDIKGKDSYIQERQIMRRQVSHMRRLVDDLLDVSRIVQGKLQIRKEPVYLRSVVEQAIEAVQPAVLLSDRTISVTMPDDVWVKGDETRLVQVITNLLSNALHFDQTGQVSLAVSHKNDQARLLIKDEGEGMAPETVSQIFVPFYQAPQSVARPSGGLGLGLAIVQSIVELHGGRVSATSEGIGRGSTFEITLPTVRPGNDQTSGKQQHVSFHPRQIVVIDDNVDAGDTISQMLKIAGHSVMLGHNARAALTLIANSQPDVAILDIGLPDMDGFELAKTVRSQNPHWTGKLIALTGYGQESDKAKAAAAGFDHHLTKPVDGSELLRVVG